MKLLRKLEPLVKKLADFYGIEMRRKYKLYGQNHLIVENEETEQRFIPRSTYFNTRSGNITVGRNTMFGENVMVITGKHLDRSEATEEMPEHSVPTSGRDIYIGIDCFIGSGAIISGGVTIGNHSVVGAGAVVVKDVPEGVFVAGVPARVKRSLYGGR